MAGYARPELLAETDWLAQHLADPNIRIIDCDDPEAYKRAHIPGAVALPIHHYIKDPENPQYVMSAEMFAEAMGSLGVSNDTTVVVYDGDAGHYACRLWWALDYYGHSRAKVMNGDWTKWFAEGRPINIDVPAVKPARFQIRPGPDSLCTLDDVRNAIGDKGAVIWDVRSREEHIGQDPRENKYSGHIPGAVHLEWRRLVDENKHGVWKPAQELRRMLAEAGITPDRVVLSH